MILQLTIIHFVYVLFEKIHAVYIQVLLLFKCWRFNQPSTSIGLTFMGYFLMEQLVCRCFVSLFVVNIRFYYSGSFDISFVGLLIPLLILQITIIHFVFLLFLKTIPAELLLRPMKLPFKCPQILQCNLTNFLLLLWQAYHTIIAMVLF